MPYGSLLYLLWAAAASFSTTDNGVADTGHILAGGNGSDGKKR